MRHPGSKNYATNCRNISCCPKALQLPAALHAIDWETSSCAGFQNLRACSNLPDEASRIATSTGAWESTSIGEVDDDAGLDHAGQFLGVPVGKAHASVRLPLVDELRIG